MHISRRLAERVDEVADLITAENGKPLMWAKAEAGRAVSVFRWAAENARQWSGEVMRLDTDARRRVMETGQFLIDVKAGDASQNDVGSPAFHLSHALDVTGATNREDRARHAILRHGAGSDLHDPDEPGSRKRILEHGPVARLKDVEGRDLLREQRDRVEREERHGSPEVDLNGGFRGHFRWLRATL